MARRSSTTRGFKRTASLLGEQIRRTGETRGFAQARLLTQWEEIAGADMAAVAHPVKVSYGRGSFGATLTLLTTGAHAPMLEMQKEQLRARVNAVYGYNAIVRIRITQTAPTGFADGMPAWQTPPKPAATGPTPDIAARAAVATAPVHDAGLRAALARLGENVLAKSKP